MISEAYVLAQDQVARSGTASYVLAAVPEMIAEDKNFQPS